MAKLTKAQRSANAKKAARTRKANKAKKSAAARKGARTRSGKGKRSSGKKRPSAKQLANQQRFAAMSRSRAGKGSGHSLDARVSNLEQITGKILLPAAVHVFRQEGWKLPAVAGPRQLASGR